MLPAAILKSSLRQPAARPRVCLDGATCQLAQRADLARSRSTDGRATLAAIAALAAVHGEKAPGGRRRPIASPARQGMNIKENAREAEQPVVLKSRWRRAQLTEPNGELPLKVESPRRSRGSSRESYRHSSPRRSQSPRRSCQSPRRPREGSEAYNRGGKGVGKRAPMQPLARPGIDEDGRLKKIDDDPRYFNGAELGKAQKASLGITGLVGRNTASFDPKSTLVRPAMRISYGPPTKKYPMQLKMDDVVIVPDFFCEEGRFDAYCEASKEITSGGSTNTLDLASLPTCARVVSKLCKYFSIEEGSAFTRVVWLPPHGSDSLPCVQQSHDFDGQFPKQKNCLASVVLGATREHASIRPTTFESIFFPQENGAAMLMGRDACQRWRHGVNVRADSWAGAAASRYGHVNITVIGRSAAVHEEKLLLPAPSDEQKGSATYDGQLTLDIDHLPRPSMRVITVPRRPDYGKNLRHDDVVIVPEFFCSENDWDIYYRLIEEMRTSQAHGDKKAEWVSWHEGAHLLSQNPTGSRTYQEIIDRMCDYFSIAPGNRGTRFNWYRDGADWKPFHHDSAAFNPMRAKNQNTTIGVSFGESRELAFRHAKTGELIYFPQKNGMLFYFGRDANIIWQHGINALPEEEQTGKGRISIILWGLCTTAIDEPGAPEMLTDDSRGGKGKESGKGKGKGKGGFSMHSNDRSSQVCRDFQRGSCRFGDRCRFSHG